MFGPTLFMAVLTMVVFYAAYKRGVHLEGLKAAWTMLFELLPILVFAFLLAGLVQYLVPEELLSVWVGERSGFKGILIGSLAGACAPGGPYVSFPIAAALLRSGAGIPTMVAFVTGWSLWALARIPLEVGILGWRFALIRLASVCLFPPLAGVIAQGLMRLWR